MKLVTTARISEKKKDIGKNKKKVSFGQSNMCSDVHVAGAEWLGGRDATR